jgi:hypothetical protein
MFFIVLVVKFVLVIKKTKTTMTNFNSLKISTKHFRFSKTPTTKIQKMNTNIEFTELCYDIVANIVSFIPQIKQQVVAASIPSIRDRFKLIDQNEFWNWDIKTIDAKNWKKLVKRAFLLLPEIGNTTYYRLVRLITVGNEFKTMSGAEKSFLNADHLWSYLEDDTEQIHPSLLYFISHFKTIRRLSLSLNLGSSLYSSQDKHHWVYFLLRCMPRLETVIAYDNKHFFFRMNSSKQSAEQLAQQKQMDELFPNKPFRFVNMYNSYGCQENIYQIIEDSRPRDTNHNQSQTLMLDLNFVNRFHVGSKNIDNNIGRIIHYCFNDSTHSVDEKVLGLISHCAMFQFSVSEWRQLMSPRQEHIFKAIIERIKCGETLQTVEQFEALFYDEFNGMLRDRFDINCSNDNFNTLAPFVRKSFSLPHTAINKNISIHSYEGLISDHIFPQYSFELRSLDFYRSCSSLRNDIVERVKIHTYSQIGTKSFIQRFLACERSVIVATLNIFKTNKQGEALSQSMQLHWKEWELILGKVMEQKTNIIKWMLTLAPLEKRDQLSRSIQQSIEANKTPTNPTQETNDLEPANKKQRIE